MVIMSSCREYCAWVIKSLTPFQKEFDVYPESGELKWKATGKLLSTGSIDIEIECLYDYTISNLWSIDAELEIEIPSDGTRILKLVRIDKYHTSFKIDQITVAKILEGEKYTSRVFLIKTLIKSATGIEILQLDYHSIPRNIDSEVLLNVDDHKFYADKYALMYSSSVFRKLLSHSNEVKIKGVGYQIFEIFLQLLYGNGDFIEYKNKTTLYRLAAQFEVHFLTANIEEYFISTNKYCNGKKLGIAERNRMPKLQAVIVDKITFDEVDDFLVHKKYNWGSETSKVLLKKFFETDNMKPKSRKECLRVFPTHVEFYVARYDLHNVPQNLMLYEEAFLEVCVPRDKSVQPKNELLTPKVGNVQWKIVQELREVRKLEFLSVSIECLYDFEASNLWEFEAEIMIEELKDNVLQSRKKMDFCFNRRDTKIILRNDVEMRDLSKPEDMESDFTTRTIVRRKSVVGIRMAWNSIGNSIDSTTRIIVDNHRFRVDKYALMALSPVFHEPLAKVIEIKDVKYEDFKEFLRFLNLHEPHKITNENVIGLLEFSQRYDVQCLIAYCENYLISTNDISNETKLQLAENYRLLKLQVETLDTLTGDEMLGIIKNADHSIGSKTLEALLINLYNALKREVVTMSKWEFAQILCADSKWDQYEIFAMLQKSC